jgi:carboxyl-terminal processing protease
MPPICRVSKLNSVRSTTALARRSAICDQGDDLNTYIRATFEDAPAARAGLGFGDKIVAVDGQSMKGKNFSEVRKFLLGPLGTQVKVTVEHTGTARLKR